MTSKHLRRAVGTTALAAMFGALSGMPSASAAISTQTFCAAVEPGQSGFTDIGSVAPAQRSDIECLAASQITSGTTATTYTPTGSVFRANMATFVAKLVDTANALESTTLAALPPSPPDAFTDDEGNIHEGNIDRLAAADIVQGTGGSNFSPGNPVNRGQMATFLVEAVEYMTNGQLPAGTDAFTDDEGNVHEVSINKLAGIDVVDGVGGSSYSPNTTVSRAQMASFLIRTLAYMHAEDLIEALDPSAQTIRLSPAGPVTSETDDPAVSFTASNIITDAVDIALFACDDVSGGAVFDDANPDDGLADRTDDAVEADIASVNGAEQAADTEFVSGVTVTNNAVTFTVDSDQMDCVVAVVWDDEDDDDALDVEADGRPSERFGLAAIEFVPPAAPAGAMDEDVVDLDKAANQFTGCEIGPAGGIPGAGPFPEDGPNAVSATDCGVFTYDSGDQFFVDANGNLSGQGDEAVSLAEFEALLSVGDDMSGTYTPGGASSFVLTDEDQPSDTDAPESVDTELQSTDAIIGGGDTIVLCFDEAITDPDEGFPPLTGVVETIRLADDDTVATLTDGENAEFSLGGPTDDTRVALPPAATCPAANTLVIDITGPPAFVSGSDAVLSAPADLTAASGITDLEGNEYTPADDDDNVVDDEDGAEPN